MEQDVYVIMLSNGGTLTVPSLDVRAFEAAVRASSLPLRAKHRLVRDFKRAVLTGNFRFIGVGG